MGVFISLRSINSRRAATRSRTAQDGYKFCWENDLQRCSAYFESASRSASVVCRTVIVHRGAPVATTGSAVRGKLTTEPAPAQMIDKQHADMSEAFAFFA